MVVCSLQMTFANCNLWDSKTIPRFWHIQPPLSWVGGRKEGAGENDSSDKHGKPPESLTSSGFLLAREKAAFGNQRADSVQIFPCFSQNCPNSLLQKPEKREIFSLILLVRTVRLSASFLIASADRISAPADSLIVASRERCGQNQTGAQRFSLRHWREMKSKKFVDIFHPRMFAKETNGHKSESPFC